MSVNVYFLLNTSLTALGRVAGGAHVFAGTNVYFFVYLCLLKKKIWKIVVGCIHKLVFSDDVTPSF